MSNTSSSLLHSDINASAYSIEKTLQIHTPSIVHPFSPHWIREFDINLWIKRDDQLHPIISGNKWRKLKYQMAELVLKNIQHIVSFGGGFSNHLHALGYTCHQLGIKLTAIVRGHYPTLTPMLRDLKSWGVEIQFVNKLEYQKRHSVDYLNHLKVQFTDCEIIPEGGSNSFGMQGVAELANEIPQNIDNLILPVASGGTMAGLINGFAKLSQDTSPTIQLLGIGVLKGEGYLENLVREFLDEHLLHLPKWRIHHNATFGGYAKKNECLIQFCNETFEQTGVMLEPVYSGKCLYGLKQLLEQGAFQPKSNILMIHTGGIQGSR